MGVAVLWLSSTPIVSHLAIRIAEGWAERRLAADASPSNAIVVLSEGRDIAPGKAAVSEWRDADRFFGGVELFTAGKAPLLVFTGGAAPWEHSATLEGDILADYATALGVPARQIAKTSRAENTEQEARAVSTLLHRLLASSRWREGPLRVLLVTSAFHMPRARTQFERAGFSVTPFPVDFQGPPDGTVPGLGLLPSAAALRQTEMAMREGYGRLYYFLVR